MFSIYSALIGYILWNKQHLSKNYVQAIPCPVEAFLPTEVYCLVEIQDVNVIY